MALEDLAQPHDFLHVPRVEAGDHDPAPALRPDQSLLLQPVQRLPDWRPAGSEVPGQAVLHQASTGPQLALQDPRPQHAVHLLAEKPARCRGVDAPGRFGIQCSPHLFTIRPSEGQLSSRHRLELEVWYTVCSQLLRAP